jgi:hypothetical protein
LVLEKNEIKVVARFTATTTGTQNLGSNPDWVQVGAIFYCAALNSNALLHVIPFYVLLHSVGAETTLKNNEI